jgi:5'-3' exonuclease
MNKAFDKIFNKLKEDRAEEKNQHKNSKIFIVDGLNTFIRAFAVDPSRNDDGIHIGGIGGFLKSLGYGIRKTSPTRCIVVFDGKGGSKRRKKIFGGYKSGRSSGTPYNRNYNFEEEDEDEAMKRQVVRVAQYLDALPVTTMSVDHIEADDAIAYLTKQVYTDPDNEICIMSSDRDFLQLVNPRISVWSPTKKIIYNPEKVVEDYEIPPHNFLIYRSIQGDKSDSIPGIHLVGDKRIKKFLGDLVFDREPHNIDDVMRYTKERLDESRIYERIAGGEEVMRRNWELMQLHDVNISAEKKAKIVDKARQEIPPLDRTEFRKMFMADKMWSAFSSIDSWLNKTFTRLDRMARVNQS